MDKELNLETDDINEGLSHNNAGVENAGIRMTIIHP